MSANEIRIDPLNGSKTIVASARADRPGGGFTVKPHPEINATTDPFLEGHENQTPPELFAIRPNSSKPNTPGWQVRVVPNLYPALNSNNLNQEQVATTNKTAPEEISLTTPGELPISFHNSTQKNSKQNQQPTANDFFSASPATGSHEVIINSPQAFSSLAQLSLDQLELAMDTWQQRMRVHSNASYVHMSINEGAQGGASLPHTHGQLYALPFVPATVARERERFNAYATQTLGGNLLTDLIQEEVRINKRIVSINNDVVLLAPFASRTPFQLMIAPRKTASRYENEPFTAATMLDQALQGLTKYLGSTPSLNIWIRTAPRGAEHFCWHIDIFPRLTTLAAFELGLETNLCTLSPEQAAKRLKSVLP